MKAGCTNSILPRTSILSPCFASLISGHSESFTRAATVSSPERPAARSTSTVCPSLVLGSMSLSGRVHLTQLCSYFAHTAGFSRRATVRVGDEDWAVQAGSVVLAPPRVPHRFHSITEELRVLV